VVFVTTPPIVFDFVAGTVTVPEHPLQSTPAETVPASTTSTD
jgi:hypothetical protein